MKKVFFVIIFWLFIAGSLSKASAATITVCASGCTNTNAQFQTALNNAAAGDTILLQVGTTYTGDFLLKGKSCPANNATCYITIRTGVDGVGAQIATTRFPATNVRITPTGTNSLGETYSSILAKIIPLSNNQPAFRTEEPPATVPNWYKFQWLEIKGNTYGGTALMALGGDDRTVWTDTSKIPHDYTIDQCYFHSRPEVGQHRALQVNVESATITNNYFEDIKSVDEGQVVWVSSSRGNITITNNYMDGGAETFLSWGSSGCCRQINIAVQASPAPTTTSARLASTTDLTVGKGLTFLVSGAEQYTEIATINTGTGDVTFSPALPNVPDVPGGASWGLVTDNVTFTKNYVTKNPAYKNPIVGTPTGVSANASTSGGTLTAGSYFYKVVARQAVNNGQTARSTASNEVSATCTTATCSITISWSAVTNATSYYIYGRSSGGENIRFSVTAPTVTFTDTGGVGTTENVPTSTGTVWQTKNVFEVKNGTNWLIEGNVFENVWKQAQPGYIVVLTPITQSSGSGIGNGNDSAVVRNITVRNNIIRHGNGCVNLTGRDADSYVSGRTQNITIYNNLCYDIDGSVWGSSERSILISSGGISSQSPTRMPDSVTINHNTIYHKTGNANLYLDGFRSSTFQTIPNFIVTNNIFRKGPTFGLFAAGVGEGNISSYQGTGSSYDKNIFAGATCSAYPAGTSCPTTTQLDTNFVNVSADNYNLTATSIYKNAGTDGKDYGADIAQINALTDIAISGNNNTVVIPTYPPMVFGSSPAIPSGTAGAGYPTIVFDVTGGLEPYTYSITSGSLPPGLTLNPTTGSISGATTTAGTYNARITATDSQAPGTGTPFTAFRDIQIVVVEVIFPEPRPDKYNQNERVFFGRETAPGPPDDQIKVGDLWFDIANNVYNAATTTSPSVTWASIASLLNGQHVLVLTDPHDSSTWTNQPQAETEFLNIASKRIWFDASRFNQVRMTIRVLTGSGSANTPKCYTKYSTDDSAFTAIATDVSLTSVGTIKSAWIDIPQGAKADVVWGLFCSGGDGAADPVIGITTLQFKY